MLVCWQFFSRLCVFTSSTHIWYTIQRVTFPLVPLLRPDDFRIALQRINGSLNPRLNWIQNKAAWLVHQHNQCFLHLREFRKPEFIDPNLHCHLLAVSSSVKWGWLYLPSHPHRLWEDQIMSWVWKHFVSHTDRPGIEVYFYHLLTMRPLKCYFTSLSLQYL